MNDNIIKGYEYEIYINALINSHNDTKISYLWKDVPDQILFDANIINNYNAHRLNRKNNKNINPLHDFGIDIIQITKFNELVFVQCKNYSGTLKVDHLGGFF